METLLAVGTFKAPRLSIPFWYRLSAFLLLGTGVTSRSSRSFCDAFPSKLVRQTRLRSQIHRRQFSLLRLFEAVKIH